MGIGEISAKNVIGGGSILGCYKGGSFSLCAYISNYLTIKSNEYSVSIGGAKMQAKKIAAIKLMKERGLIE